MGLEPHVAVSAEQATPFSRERRADYCRRGGAFSEEIGRPALAGERGLSGYSEFMSAGDSDVTSAVPI